MLKLRLQYFGYPMQRGNSLREDPDVENKEDRISLLFAGMILVFYFVK